ncbi:hypothetical protein PRUPE_8G042300 [Prunus persica]|uniref:Uncharacterized protein n=1 Tax=Prunus persica TaxID=3760 RepID=A0A251MSV9_PRUPE|nr:hypothetical protein PRUPE_8G042300 [Prunus persica]
MFEHYHLHPLNTLSGKFNASVIKEFYSNFPVDPKGSNYQIVVHIYYAYCSSTICCQSGFRFSVLLWLRL